MSADVHTPVLKAATALALLLAAALLLPAGASARAVSFGFTGSAQWFTVPAGVHQIKIEAIGAGGGEAQEGEGGLPGKGAKATYTFNVNPGEELQVNVGGSPTDKVGGWNGGGWGGYSADGPDGGAGGGASDVRRGGTGLADRIIVAGGGGGAGGGEVGIDAPHCNGGQGGGLEGSPGSACENGEGYGGTQLAGGSGGSGWGTGAANGDAGSEGFGGAGGGISESGLFTPSGGGGGGGGYFGGGGGGAFIGGNTRAGGGGGGGSSYTPDGSGLDPGFQLGNGEVLITYMVTPTLTSTASAGVSIGGQVHDTATLAEAESPAGQITFYLYGPGDANCSGAPVYSSEPVTVTGNGSYESAAFTPSQVGTYRWVASYTGDVDNNEAKSACGAAEATVTVAKAVPSLTLAAGPGGQLGVAELDAEAAIAGGLEPSGNLEFRLYGPEDATCTGTPAFTDSSAFFADGSYPSDRFIPTKAGTYRWVVSYAGDEENAAAATSCNEASTTVSVSKATPTLTTATAATMTAGEPIHDTATVAGGVGAGGHVEFTLYGPGDPTCAGTPAFTGVSDVSSGTAQSPAFTPAAAGEYVWVAAYEGDANNEAAADACGEGGEKVTVVKASPGLTASVAAAAMTVGQTTRDTATLSGGYNPGGQISFKLYGPADPTCAGTPAFTVTTAISERGAQSPDFRPTLTGSYRWVASYSGDAANEAATGSCGEAEQQVTFGKASPSLSLQASSAVVGAAVSATATLSGGFSPGGQLTFSAYGPGSTDCSGAAAFTTTVPLESAPTGTASFIPAAAGTYSWVATYSGDEDNQAAAASCATLRVGKRATAISLDAAARGHAQIVARAKLSGAGRRGNSLVLRLYAPGDAKCSGRPLASQRVRSRDGVHFSTRFAVSAPGLYRLGASFPGDPESLPASTKCGARGSAVRVER